MKRILVMSATAFWLTATTAAVQRDPATGIWFGNICQTPVGWQAVQPAPVGSACWSPGWNSWGFIANY